MASLSGASGGSQEYRDLGPWGEKHGQPFDDRISANIKQIKVYLVNNSVSGIKIEYADRYGGSHWSPLRGGTGDEYLVPIGPDEFLTGIEGFYGPADEEFTRPEGSRGSTEGSVRGHFIKSLKFTKDDGTKIDPAERQIGFSPSVARSKVVGFFGWADQEHLNAIGIHVNI